MLQQEVADDYVIATGESHTVREFVEAAFRITGVDIEWRGKGVKETGVDAATGTVRVQIDPRYFRPTEVDCLIGDASKAERILGWRATIGFDELVADMVRADRAVFASGQMQIRYSA